MRPWPADILHFWFFELRPDQWFGRSDLVDAELRRRFGRVPHRDAELGRKSTPAETRAVAEGNAW